MERRTDFSSTLPDILKDKLENMNKIYCCKGVRGTETPEPNTLSGYGCVKTLITLFIFNVDNCSET